MSSQIALCSTALECLDKKYCWIIGDLRQSWSHMGTVEKIDSYRSVPDTDPIWDTCFNEERPIESESYTIFPDCKDEDCSFRMELLKNTTDDECILRLCIGQIQGAHLKRSHKARTIHYSVDILGSDGIKSLCDEDMNVLSWYDMEELYGEHKIYASLSNRIDLPIKIAKEDLQNGSGVLNKGCLEIRVVLKVTRFVISSTERSRREISQAGSWTSDMKVLLDSGRLADFEIKTKDRTFKVHKFVLGLRSPVFRAMLEADMKESREKSLNLEHIETNIVELFLRFIYMDKLDAEMTHEATIELLKLADTYQLEYLKTICASKLADNLTVGNVIDLLELAERHNSELLGIAAREFIRINRRSLTGLQFDLVKLVLDFPELGREVMSLLMS